MRLLSFIYVLSAGMVLIAGASFGQNDDLKYLRYDTDLLSKDFHKGRREEVRRQMPDKSVAVFFAAPERNRSNDDNFQYHQDPNFYYLTGFTESNAMLLIFKEKQNLAGIQSYEYLFVQSKDPNKEMWTGRRMGINGAKQLLGIDAVLLNRDFNGLEIPFQKFDKVLTLPFPKGIVDDKKDNIDLYDLVEQFKTKSGYPSDNNDNVKLSKIMSALREIKQPEEIALMRKAITMSCDGHIEVMKALKPGMHEYDAQAIAEYIFKKNGSEYVGYPSICGGGENACILHYGSNRRPLSSGDLQLNDMGAEYHGYSADVTRTIPVNGEFSEEQRAIYSIVKEAQDAGFAACKPGNDFQDPGKAATDVIKKGLVRLGITKDENEYRKYFPHGTSHYLGLDVHDAGVPGNLEAGNVITVEPGIYIPEGSPCDKKWWNIGVRIEDDILITDTGYENLSAKAPRSIEEIEALMKEKNMFKQSK